MSAAMTNRSSVRGSLARYYEEVGGETEYFGKPYPEMFVAALEGYEDIAPGKES